jgi:hypothetical protein
MTQTAPRRDAGNMPNRLAGWIARLQRQLSDRLFAAEDAFAREHEWEITRTTGRFGFGTRSYRDPRFGQRSPVPQGRERTGWRHDAGAG